jgi:hypothetical protein
MEHFGLMGESHYFVEFGAGKARLSAVIAQYLDYSQTAKWILIDRENSRHKVKYVFITKCSLIESLNLKTHLSKG